MAQVCDICGKGPQFGNNISHAHNVTRRRWNVNLQAVKALVNGAPKRLRVCASCIKSGKITKAGRVCRKDRRVNGQLRTARMASTKPRPCGWGFVVPGRRLARLGLLAGEGERGGVDAVAQAGGTGAVGEDVAEVASAAGAGDLDAAHAEARSSCSSTALESAGSMKLGQPQPESNLAPLMNRSAPQPAQW